jgi:hypothetical protein
MNTLDDTQPIPRYQNLPNWPTDKLKRWRAKAVKKRDEKLTIAARHEAGTPWNTRANRQAGRYKVLSKREQA